MLMIMRHKSGEPVLMMTAKTSKGFNKDQKALKKEVRKMLEVGMSASDIRAHVARKGGF